MKTCGYKESHFPSKGERQEEINGAKREDANLPFFSREVPVSSKRRDTIEGVAVDYSWKQSKNPNIKVKSMLFEKNEKELGDLYRIDRKDGIDRLSIERRGKTYILRKTAEYIAKALYRVADRIKDSSERIVGYLKSLFGSVYVISVIESEAWSFDGRLTSENIKYLDMADINQNQKKKLSDLVVEKLSSLHSKNLVLGNFTLDSVLLLNNGMKFTDLRGLRASRKKSFTVEEFKRILRYLLSAGIAEQEDVISAVAYYISENSENCQEWYSENTGKEADEVTVASKIEEDILY